MTDRAATRVLLPPLQRPLPRPALDWIVERLRHARVIVPPPAEDAAPLPARCHHPPFTPSAPETGAAAARLAAWLATAASPRLLVEVVALALLEEGAVIAVAAEDAVAMRPLSSWSMNTPRRPTDGLLLRHLGIASRLPRPLRAGSAAALQALRAAEAQPLTALVRARRLAARADGPQRFRLLGRTSAGLRPLVVYLDLLPLLAARPAAAADLLESFGPGAAEALLSTAAALFI
jgi:hypothetical protein